MRGVNPEVLCQIQQLGEELELWTTNCSGKPTSQPRTKKSRKQMLHRDLQLEREREFAKD